MVNDIKVKDVECYIKNLQNRVCELEELSDNQHDTIADLIGISQQQTATLGATNKDLAMLIQKVIEIESKL